MPLKDIIDKINAEAEQQAKAIIESATSEARKIREDAKSNAKAKAREIEEMAKKELSTRRQFYEQSNSAEEAELLDSAFDEAVERATKQVIVALSKELEKHIDEIIASAIEQFMRSVPKEEARALVDRKYEKAVKSKGIEVIEKAASPGELVLESSDKLISMHISAKQIAEANKDLVASLVAKELKKKVQL
ncbi:MAG: hypothetical protein QXR85_02040 [Candidatus Micrarchaeaceae archaeon]